MFFARNSIEIVFLVLFALFVLFYFYIFYTSIVKKDIQRRFLRRFYNAICNIYEENASRGFSDDSRKEYCFMQLNLDYVRLCQDSPNNNYTCILEPLETIIYYYDCYTNILFNGIFRQNKKLEVKNFIVDMCIYLKKINPFIAISQKDAELMHTIMDALKNNNSSLGLTSLKQLSQEIETKEKLILKKDKENQMATIVSIVGVILTVFFGLLSLVPFFKG